MTRRGRLYRATLLLRQAVEGTLEFHLVQAEDTRRVLLHSPGRPDIDMGGRAEVPGTNPAADKGGGCDGDSKHVEQRQA